MSLRNSFLIKIFSLVILATGLTACGYQPLHGKRQTAQNTAMQDELANIWIQEIKDRDGQLLHNELLTLFNTKGRPKKPKYILRLIYSDSSSGLGISKDDFATRANFTVSVKFWLRGLSEFEGSTQSVVSYNILTSPTGTEFAKRDAQLRAIKSVATDIHRRIAVHLLNTQK